jgi:hypothetical protein
MPRCLVFTVRYCPGNKQQEAALSFPRSGLLLNALLAAGMRGFSVTHIGENPRRFVSAVRCRANKKSI